jgi:hypothetical protein
MRHLHIVANAILARGDNNIQLDSGCHATAVYLLERDNSNLHSQRVNCMIFVDGLDINSRRGCN